MSKENLYFDNQSYQAVFLFLLQCFLKELEHMFSVFLLSYRNSRESLGQLEKAVEIIICNSCSHCISRFPKLPLVFIPPLKCGTCIGSFNYVKKQFF